MNSDSVWTETQGVSHLGNPGVDISSLTLLKRTTMVEVVWSGIMVDRHTNLHVFDRGHSSSESSESEQNIDSADDSQSTNLLDVNKNLLEKVIDLRLKRQEVELKMKHYKRKTRSAQVKYNAIMRKIQKINDAMNETYEKLNSLMETRKQTFDTFIWPFVLYPSNIHSDYFSNKNNSPVEQEQLIEIEMSRIYQVINQKVKVVKSAVNASVLLLSSKVISAEIQDMVDVASVFSSVLDSVSASTDDYFENLELSESLESVGSYHELKDEKINIIGKILATVKDPISLPEISSFDSMSKESISSERTSDEKEYVTSREAFEKEYFVEVFGLDQFQDEHYEIKEEKLRSWHDVCNDMDLLGMIDKSHLHFEETSKIFSSAIPCSTTAKAWISSDSSTVDYFMCPFTYDTPEKIQDKEGSNEEGKTDTSNHVEETNDHEDDLEQDYPTYSQGGLVLTLPVLSDMEKDDPESFPYTNFYQDIESHEELKAIGVREHIKPTRTLEMDTLYNFIPTPLFDFVLVNTWAITYILNFYSKVKASSHNLEQELNLLQDEVMSTKRALSFKQQDLIKAKRELYAAMKSKFFHVIDLNLLQDTIENPHFYVKQSEFKAELDVMKKKLKKMKESETLALKSIDQLRLEDTQICYELLELRKDFRFLNENYSAKCQVLPKIGALASPKEDIQSSEENP
ncbi:uncharacterized protein TNCV_2587881 [Trichonephila clavipes]|nr:uncharacterized protein TNCV_2587881 [Trichonephila clavipes]